MQPPTPCWVTKATDVHSFNGSTGMQLLQNTGSLEDPWWTTVVGFQAADVVDVWLDHGRD